jgi:hypothetical protein
MSLSAVDRLDILELVARYGHALDDRDWSAFASIFTRDAIVDFQTGSALAPMEGLDSIVHHYRDVGVHPLQHIVVSSIIDEVSQGHVVVRSKALFPISGNQVFEGLYTDLVVNTSAGWRIKHKHVKHFDTEISSYRRAAWEQMKARGAQFIESP